MSKYFNGFDGFDCREEIWYGVFHANAHGGTKRLREMLSDPKDLPEDSAVFTRKLKGENAWTCEPNKLFSYSEDPQMYHQNWLEQWTNPPGCLEVFRRFMASVPENVPNSDHARFLPPARKVCSYLEQILLHCGSHPNDSEKWIAAGMYVLTAFFLQNSKSTTPRFYCPPKEYDPVSIGESTVVVPDVMMCPPEVEEGQYDFFDALHQKHQKLFWNEAESLDELSPDEDIPHTITVASIRRELVHFDRDFTIIDPEGMSTKAFGVEPFLVRKDEIWCNHFTLREMAYEEGISVDGKNCRKFLVAYTAFTDDGDHNGILLTIAKDGSKNFLNTFLFTCDNKLYVSRKNTQLGLSGIDISGHLRDLELENLLEFCGVDSSVSETTSQPVKWRRFTSKFNPEYLQYLIVDPDTMETISPTFTRDPNSGEYLLDITIPSKPLLILNVTTKTSDLHLDRLAVAGFLHGAYGLKKNPEKAKEIAKRGAENGDLQMAFEYGAILKQNGVAISAEYQLRRAADANIPGAQFELAELLYNKATHTKPSEEKEPNQYLWDKNYQDWALTEAKKLIDDLWSRGYRTYGQASIDLFGEHT